MKRFLVRRGGQIAGILLLGLPGTLRATDVTDDLEGFRKKVAEQEATLSADARSRGPQLSLQIKQLENLITRGDSERALQVIENLGNYGLPSQLQEEWLRISALLGQELEKRKGERLEKWAAAVDQLVKDTKKTCLEAKAPEDLDPLLLRCSAVQMQADRGGNVMTERLNRKLQGVVQTLTSWTTYLDFHNSGDGKRANDALRLLENTDPHFPVLTVAEIESRLAPVADTQMDARTALARIFAGMTSPNDLPTALERLESISGNPQNQQLSSLKNEAARITGYIDAWKAAQAGDVTTALTMLSRSVSGFEEAQRYYVPLKAQIEARIIKLKAETWTKLPQGASEDARIYLGRILDEMKERADYAAMLDVMSFASQIDRTVSPLFSSADRQAVEQFLAAQRFEKAGDDLAAITSYRIAIGLSAGKYTAADKAQEALKGLVAKHPEGLKSYDGVLSEQIRALGQQIQTLQQSRPMGAPYRPF